MTVHLVKLCVGAASVEELAAWQAERMRAAAAGEAAAAAPVHVTRMWPRRADALLAGGSLYWVFRGLILARQRVLALAPQPGPDGRPRCAITLDPAIVRVRPQPRRAFQGWRYLLPEEAPPDLDVASRPREALPPKLAAELAAIGVLPVG